MIFIFKIDFLIELILPARISELLFAFEKTKESLKFKKKTFTKRVSN